MGSRCQSLSSFGINDFRLFDSVWNSLFPWWTKETPHIISPLLSSNQAHVHIQHLYRYQHLSIVICVSIFICVSTISIIISQSYLVGMYQNAASTSINRSTSVSSNLYLPTEMNMRCSMDAEQASTSQVWWSRILTTPSSTALSHRWSLMSCPFKVIFSDFED